MLLQRSKPYNCLYNWFEHLWFQVSPVELETILLLHPSVREAGVVGKRVTEYLEEPAAFVVKQQDADVTEQELIDYMAREVSSIHTFDLIRWGFNL